MSEQPEQIHAPNPSYERDNALYDLHAIAHWSVMRLSYLFNVTPERVRQIVSKEAGRRRRMTESYKKRQQERS